MTEKTKIKPLNSKQIASLFGISELQFLSWRNLISDRLGKQKGRIWSIKQVNIIFDEFGNPYEND